MNKIINEVIKKVNAEKCMQNEGLKDLRKMMLNDLVRYHLNETLLENNIKLTNTEFENNVKTITNYDGDFTKDFLLTI